MDQAVILEFTKCVQKKDRAITVWRNQAIVNQASMKYIDLVKVVKAHNIKAIRLYKINMPKLYKDMQGKLRWGEKKEKRADMLMDSLEKILA